MVDLGGQGTGGGASSSSEKRPTDGLTIALVPHRDAAPSDPLSQSYERDLDAALRVFKRDPSAANKSLLDLAAFNYAQAIRRG